jgi:hypothetical protein
VSSSVLLQYLFLIRELFCPVSVSFLEELTNQKKILKQERRAHESKKDTEAGEKSSRIKKRY